MIEIELEEREVPAGGVVRGRVRLVPTEEEASRRVELSVLWETEGKGDTDRGVVHFAVLADGDPSAARREHAFEVRLPLMPVTYDGVLLRIRWCVRVRRRATFDDDQSVDWVFTVVARTEGSAVG
jgi:hypothetical protein